MQGGGMLFLASASLHKSTLENDIDGLLKTSVESFATRLKGTVVSSERIELKGVKGTFAVMTIGEQNAKVEYRVFLKENKQYHVISAQLETEFDQETADAFSSRLRF